MTMDRSRRPSRRQVLIAGGLGGGVFAAGALKVPAVFGVRTGERRGVAFGTVVSLKAVHHDQRALDAALDAAWAEIATVESAASLYREKSALSRLNRDGHLAEPPSTLRDLVTSAVAVARLTEGAFDPTVQPLWTVHARAAQEGRDVRADELSAVAGLIGWQGIDVTAEAIRFARPGMALTLNGIAQGYATGRALAALKAHGVTDAFLDTGELAAVGHRSDGSGWGVAIADPRKAGETLALSRPLEGVLATSGDYATAFSADFARNHIFDPTTLRSPAELASVSVLASDGAMADGLATAFMVMGAERSLALAARLPHVEAFVISKSGKRAGTPGFPLA